MPENFMSGYVVRVYQPGGFGYVKEKTGNQQFIFQLRQFIVNPTAGEPDAGVAPTASPLHVVVGTPVRFTLDHTGRVEKVIPKTNP